MDQECHDPFWRLGKQHRVLTQLVLSRSTLLDSVDRTAERSCARLLSMRKVTLHVLSCIHDPNYKALRIRIPKQLTKIDTCALMVTKLHALTGSGLSCRPGTVLILYMFVYPAGKRSHNDDPEILNSEKWLIIRHRHLSSLHWHMST